MRVVAKVSKSLARFVRDASGATAIEYALLAGLISVACIAGFLAVGESATDLYEGVQQKVTDAMASD